MKYILSFLLPILLVTTAQAQVISYEDFRSLIPYLQREDFKGAFERSKILLDSTENDSSDLRGIVTYMHIFSAAGMVMLDEMTHAEFYKAASRFVGHRLVMPAHPCVDSTTNGYNLLQFTRKEGEIRGMTTTANSKKTNILCFEYFSYAEPIEPAELIGKNIRSGGILDKLEVNPNGSKIWIARIYITKAFARESTPR